MLQTTGLRAPVEKRRVVDRRVSVILPASVGEDPKEVEWLEESLLSVCSQKVDALQLIVIDDASQYLIAPIVRSVCGNFSHVTCDVVRKNKRGGLISALNSGLSRSSYDWIARIDADDKWLPGRLEDQFNLLDAEPSVTLCFSGMRVIPQDGAPAQVCFRGMDWPEAIFHMQTLGCPVPHGTILARKEVFELLGGYRQAPDSIACEDFFLWSVWARFFELRGTPRIALEYKQHQRSESSSKRDLQLENSQRIARNVRSWGDPWQYTAAFDEVAQKTELASFDLGKLLCRLWKLGGKVKLPRDAYHALVTVLFDRVITPCEEPDAFDVTMF